MNRADWLTWRKDGIGASDVAAILGVSPWGSPWSVFADKVGLASDETDNDAMAFGRRAEAMVAEWFHEIDGRRIVGEQTWCQHPQHPWRRCTVDGFVTDGATELAHPQDALAVAEVKTTSDAAARWEDNGIPAYYEAQAAWQAHVTGIPTVTFVVLHLAFGRPTLRVYDTTPALEDVALVVERVDAFWRDHVLTGNPPPTDGHRATGATLDRAWTDPEPDPPVEADDLADVVAELDAVKRHLAADKKRAEALENAIKARLGDHTELHVNGALAVSWRQQERTGIDTKAVRAAHGSAFDTHTAYRVVRLHMKATDHGRTPPATR